ncbi:hypothetical protein ACFE04_016057 [Oxalis oulophora]
MSSLWIQILVTIVLVVLLGRSSSAVSVRYDSHGIQINGSTKLILSGSIHYPRSTVEMWPELIRRAKEGGLNTIETYIFWDRHEPRRREYDFRRNLDFVKFFKKIHEEKLYAILRIGPYVCAEWTYGGFPMWLHNTPGIELRTDNEIYKSEMQTFTTKIIDMAKEAKLFAPQGGPIILAQIENEYGNIMEGYGDAGKRYINWCAQMAVAQNTSVPWIMCQQKDAPETMINTCNGFYCEKFTPDNPNSPKMFTENWSGWFKLWGNKDPVRTPEDLAFSVARFFQTGGSLNNYYMYHGGTNFGRVAGGPYITTSYDYNAPLNEFGLPNEPKYSHLKKLHEAIMSAESFLTLSPVTTQNITTNVTLTTYRSINGDSFCILSNIDYLNDTIVDVGNSKFFLPAWSVSFLNGCTNETYNTAKVNSQTQVFEMKTEKHEKHTKLKWAWSPEAINDTLNGNGKFKAIQLLDQKEATSDASDYLWYMTSFENNHTSWKTATLKIGSFGNGVHAYVNHKHVGTWFSMQTDLPRLNDTDEYSFVANTSITLKHGTNIISLLSETVGLANYGTKYDLKPTGLSGGFVKLIVDNSTTIDLSSSKWSYKIGLNGESKQIYKPKSHYAKWNHTYEIPTNRSLTWYKTTIDSPSGSHPVVLDLQGMGKGHVWINGKSLGRFWPSQIASSDGCNTTCDYRGPYSPDKCRNNCGNPTQRWYHVPRSFLKNDKEPNTLILFEEVGGDPSKVKFQLVKVKTVCGLANENNTLELSCQSGQQISEIQFASFGDPEGTCGSYKKGSYEATQSVEVVEKYCVGKESCSLMVTNSLFGVEKGGFVGSKLGVQAVCS